MPVLHCPAGEEGSMLSQQTPPPDAGAASHGVPLIPAERNYPGSLKKSEVSEVIAPRHSVS